MAQRLGRRLALFRLMAEAHPSEERKVKLKTFAPPNARSPVWKYFHLREAFVEIERGAAGKRYTFEESSKESQDHYCKRKIERYWDDTMTRV